MNPSFFLVITCNLIDIVVQTYCDSTVVSSQTGAIQHGCKESGGKYKLSKKWY